MNPPPQAAGRSGVLPVEFDRECYDTRLI